MKASEHLAAARDEIEKGWVQGTLQDTTGNVCAVGALTRVAKNNQPTTLDAFAENAAAGAKAAEKLAQITKEFGGHGNIMGFNDRSQNTKQDVLNWFDKSIAALEEVGE